MTDAAMIAASNWRLAVRQIPWPENAPMVAPNAKAANAPMTMEASTAVIPPREEPRQQWK